MENANVVWLYLVEPKHLLHVDVSSLLKDHQHLSVINLILCTYKWQYAAKDRTLWRSIVVALCPTGDEEDK